MANDERLLGLFEPDIHVIVRGKAGRGVEFGNLLVEVLHAQIASTAITSSAIRTHRKRHAEHLSSGGWNVVEEFMK